MFFVYAIYSPGYQKIYIGYTNNLQERLFDHNQRSTKGFTVKYRPWELVYFEKQPNKPLALKREKQLKSAQGRAFIWQKVRERYYP